MTGTEPSTSGGPFSGGWLRALAVVGAMVIALVAYTGVAHASSHNFNVFNLTDHTLRLKQVNSFNVNCLKCTPPDDGYFEGRPEIGTPLKPGGPPQDFELQSAFAGHYSAIITYSVVGTDKTWQFRIENFTREQDSTCIQNGYGVCRANGPAVTLQMPSGSVTVPAGRAQAQVDVLKQLCVKDTTATCTFAPDDATDTNPNPKSMFAPKAVIGSPVANCTDVENDQKYHGSQKFTSESSYELELGLKLEAEFFIGKAEASMTSKFGQSWGKETEFGQEESIPNKPGHLAYMTVVSPINRYYGTYTLKLGNTKWILPGVYFDTGDPNGTASLATHSDLLSPEEYKQRCGDKVGLASVRVPKSAVSLTYHGTPQRNVFNGGSSSDTYHGKAGNDIIRGGVGNDTLYGGPGNDLLVGGPGRDTIYGGPGADRILDTQGPTVVYTGRHTGPGMDRVNVRDGRGDDTVHCQTRHTIVVAGRGDRIRGTCGKVIRGHQH